MVELEADVIIEMPGLTVTRNDLLRSLDEGVAVPFITGCMIEILQAQGRDNNPDITEGFVFGLMFGSILGMSFPSLRVMDDPPNRNLAFETWMDQVTEAMSKVGKIMN